MPCKIQITKEITNLVEKQTEPFMGLSLKLANKKVEKVNKFFKTKVAKFVMIGDIMDRIITIPESLVQIYYNNELKIEEKEAARLLKEEKKKEKKYVESKKGEWEQNREYFENDEPFTRNSSSTKPNTIQGQQSSLFGLDNNNLEFHINTLGVVTNFLENIGIEPRLVSEFLSQEGTVVESAIAAANFIEGTVDIIDDLEKRPSAWNKLPEEAAHFWYRLLDTNSQLKDALLTSALTDRKEADLRNSLYGDTYKEGVKVIGKLALDSNSNITSKPALSPIREEAIGQLIAEAIKRIETKNASASDYSFFKKFLEWINSVLDTFKNTTQDPFEVAAMKILSSDMSDLMTWEEYRKLNNIVNFADVLTEQSVAPIDYTLIEDIGYPDRKATPDNPDNIYTAYTSTFVLRESATSDKIISPEFNTREELDNWVNSTYGNLLIQRQKNKIQEVKDNQIFFDRLLNKSFRKKSKFLPKTLRKYFQIIDAQNLNPLREWNISQELQQITKKLTEEEKKQIVETNGYTNIAPTLKVLPDLLQKYKKNPIVLSEPIKIDGAKKQELSILSGIKEMIKLENPNLKSITAEEFVAEAHNWLETNYLLGFANEKNYLTYHVDQTFTHVKDRFSNEASPLATMTEEEINQLPLTERQRIANIVGLTKQNPDVYHNKVSIRFNDMSHLKSGHFNLLNGGSPSAWGNLTYFYSGKNKWKDAVLLHEIQNDNIEFLRDFKAEKVDLEISLGRYLQQLNTDLLDNIAQIESGGKRIQKNYLTEKPRQHAQLNYQLQSLVSIPLEQGLDQLKQNLNEKIQLYKSDDSIRTNPEKAQEEIEKIYSQKRKFADFQRKGGIKSLLTKEELENLKEILKELNTGTIMTDAVFMADENQYEPGYETIRDLKQKKHDFKLRVNSLEQKINKELSKLYGTDFPIITLNAPAKPLPKSQRRNQVVGFGENRRVIGNASQELNTSINFLLAFSEQKMSKQLSKDIEESKKIYIQARNATNFYNFNVSLSKITQEQYNNLIENYKYNQDLLNKLIDKQAQKDIQKESVDISSLTDKEIQEKIEYTTDFDNIIGEEEDIEKAIFKVRNAYNKEEQINLQNSEYENLKKLALEKKEELDKNYGKIEDEVKQTLEIEMNYFTPLVHHLIQKHINQYGKDFPMYFSGYNITKLTQGNDRTAMIYAGKDEIDIVNKSNFTVNNKSYSFSSSNKRIIPRVFYIGEKAYSDVTGSNYEFKYFIDENIDGKNKRTGITEQEYNKAKQDYEKAYQQATERRAKEIKFRAAKEIGLLNYSDFGFEMGYDYELQKLTDKQLEEGIKKLNEYKRQSKQNMDRVINTIMNISNNKPIETGAIYNAMTQISGVKLIWQDAIPGLRPSVTPQISTATGGYLVDLSNYNYNVPILYGLDLNKKKSNIKPGAEELFESNPELANAIYSKILTDSGLSAENWEDSDNECGI